MLYLWELTLGPDFIETYEGGFPYEIIRTSEAGWIAVGRIRRHLLGLPRHDGGGAGVCEGRRV